MASPSARPLPPPTTSSSAQTAAAKPLAAHPTFPLSPVDLARWNRFAKKGGIGTARALRDKVSTDGDKDLMLLEGDEVVVLMEMGGEVYLGYCEGVVGLFHGREVQMQQAKLKRPVISSRPPSSTSTATTSSSAAESAHPPAPNPAASTSRNLSRFQTSLDLRAAPPPSFSSGPTIAAVPQTRRLSRSSSFDSSSLSTTTASHSLAGKPLPPPKRKPVPEVEVLAERFDQVASSSRRREGDESLRSRRQGEGARGLGIKVGAAPAGGRAGVGESRQETMDDAPMVVGRGRRRSKSVSEIAGEVKELLSFAHSPDLAGAFSPSAPTPFSTPHLPSSASPAQPSSSDQRWAAVASPAPSFSSSTGTATSGMTRTPSLITSPYSEFGGSHAAGTDSDTGSSAGDHGMLATPEVAQHPGGGWGDRTSVLTIVGSNGENEEGAEGRTEYLDYRFAQGDGPTPTVDKFPMPQTGLRFPPPSPFAAAEEVREIRDVAPTPASSPAVGGAGVDNVGRPAPPAKDYTPSLLSNISPSPTIPSFSQQPALRSQFSLDTLSSAPSASASSADASSASSPPFNRPTSLLPSGLPADPFAQHPRSAFSFSPSSSLVSSLPLSVLSASGYADHEPRSTKSSTSTFGSASSASTTPAGGMTPSASAPGTPYGEDPTLAFIFDSYAYSNSNASGSRAGSESGWSTPGAGIGDSPVKSLRLRRESAVTEQGEGYFPYADQEEDDLAAVMSFSSASPARAFGAASQLRSQIRLGTSVPSAPPTPTRAARTASLLPRSQDPEDSLTALNIPRMSSIFPRSATDDSLATFAPSSRSSESEDDLAGGAPLAFGMTARRAPLAGTLRRQELAEETTPPAASSVAGVRRNNTVPPPSSPSPASQHHHQQQHSPTPPRRGRSSSVSTPQSGRAVPIASQAHLAADLDASRRLFQAHFPPPREELVQAAGLAFGAPPVSPHRKDEGREVRKRKSAKGLQISAPIVPGHGLGLAAVPHSAPLWRSQHVDSPVRQRMRRGSEQEQDEDVFLASPASIRPGHPLPLLEIVGASPAAAQRYIAPTASHGHPRPSLDTSFHYPRSSPTTDSASPSLSVPAPSTSAASTPSSTSHQTFASAQSSPMTDRSSSSEHATPFPSTGYYPTPPTSAATFSGASVPPPHAGAGPNKLRKQSGGLTRIKSSPSLASFASAGSAGANDPFVDIATSPKLANAKSSPIVGLFGRSKSTFGKDRERERSQTSSAASYSTPPTSERKVDYSAGISNRDFEEETVQIGKNAFEMVKPLAVALLGTPEFGCESEEEEERNSASLDGGRPPRKSSMSGHARPSLDELNTPHRRPPPPSHMPTTTSAYSAQPAHTVPSPNPDLPTPGGSDFSRSALSLSHFSPATPSSVEDGGHASVADHRAREVKWLQVLSSASGGGKDALTSQQAKKKKALRALVHSGVPSSVRGKVWAFLAEAECRVGVYQHLCELDQLPSSSPIEHDLDTMLLDHPQFAPGTAGRDDLESVLRAFSRFDQQLGYYSGLVNVVGLLLTQMPAESAFWTLCSLVRNYGLKQFFPSSKEELRLELLAFGFLLEATEPKLAKRLRDLSLTPSDYLPIWLSTAFLSILPLPTTLRLMDLLLFDPNTRYRIPLALLDLSHLEDTVAFPTRDSVLNHLLAPPPEAFTPALLVPAVATMKLSDDKLKKAYKKAAQAMLKPQPLTVR